MKYYIIEIQQSGTESYAHLVHTADTRFQAESVYHQVLAAAAISELRCHAATLIDGKGRVLMSYFYEHGEANG